jgi:hypothetical protein
MIFLNICMKRAALFQPPPVSLIALLLSECGEMPEKFFYDHGIFLFLRQQNTITMWSSIWNAIGNFFQFLFSIMDAVSPFWNKLLIVIGFVAFFIWLNYMNKHKDVEKFD